MADFLVQRGISDQGVGDVNNTITNIGALTAAFARVTNSCFANGGPTAGSATNQSNRDLQARAFVDTTTNIVTRRTATADDGSNHRIAWECLAYTGPAGGANEFIVRNDSNQALNAGVSLLDVSVGAAASIDLTKCVGFIAGNATSGTAVQSWCHGCFTVELLNVAGTITARIERGASVVTATFRLVVVEFTGANWTIARYQFGSTVAGSDQAQTITNIQDWTHAFIVGSHRNNNSADNQNDEITVTFRPGATTSQVFIRVRAGANPAKVMEYAVIKNPLITVQHLDSITGGQADLPTGSSAPQTENYTINTVDSLARTIIWCYTDCSDTGTNYGRAFWNNRLTSTSNLEFWRGRITGDGDFAAQIVQLRDVPHPGGLLLMGVGR